MLRNFKSSGAAFADLWASIRPFNSSSSSTSDHQILDDSGNSNASRVNNNSSNATGQRVDRPPSIAGISTKTSRATSPSGRSLHQVKRSEPKSASSRNNNNVNGQASNRSDVDLSSTRVCGDSGVPTNVSSPSIATSRRKSDDDIEPITTSCCKKNQEYSRNHEYFLNEMDAKAGFAGSTTGAKRHGRKAEQGVHVGTPNRNYNNNIVDHHGMVTTQTVASRQQQAAEEAPYVRNNQAAFPGQIGDASRSPRKQATPAESISFSDMLKVSACPTECAAWKDPVSF